MISETHILDLEKLAKKNEAVASLLEFYNTVIQSPYYDSYISARNQIQWWNLEIKNNPTSIYNDSEDMNDKSFERAHKFLTTQSELISNLNAIRLQLLPQEEKEVEKVATTLMDEARIKMKQRNGEKV